MKKTKTSSLTFVQWLIVLLAVAVYLFGIPAAAWLGGRFLVNADDVQAADVVIALGGDAGFDRLEKAAELYHSGLADALIISDTQVEAFTGQDITLFMRNAAKDLGIPESDIYITEVAANTTYNEARAARKLMLRNGWTSCIVVTDPFHTRRARSYFRRDFADHDLTVYVTYTAEHWYRPSSWFMSRRGIMTTQTEYAKLFWMWMTGL